MSCTFLVTGMLNLDSGSAVYNDFRRTEIGYVPPFPVDEKCKAVTGNFPRIEKP